MSSLATATGPHLFWMVSRAAGILALVLSSAAVTVGLSFYARTKIGIARWRVLHRFTALAWLGGLAHSLGEGSDAGEEWFLVSVATVSVPALALLAARLSQRDPSGLPQPSHGPAGAS